MENTARYLQRCGIRPSFQRIAIMKYLQEHLTHPTVDTIFRDLHPTMPTLSRTTVYNTLELFHSRGAVKELNIDGNTSRYDARTDTHAHFVCRLCGRIIDMDMPEQLSKSISAISEFKVEETAVKLIGICDECAKTGDGDY